MSRLAIGSYVDDNKRIGEFLESYSRRVESMPPGTCPIAVQQSLLQTCAAQTCGKCTPCREGIPRILADMEAVLSYEADESVVADIRKRARLLRDTADCAIGYNAGDLVLQGLDAFEDEYASHVQRGICAEESEQTVPCVTLCPAHVNVPAYISLVQEGDCAGAIKMIRKDNPFPTACALVCEHPCEEHCRRTLVDAPLNIRGIKKYAVDTIAADQVETPDRAESTGKRVAVIGGGPSGMTCAYFSALMGHDVTVFEGRKKLGGMMRYGIPAYRFPRERLDEDIRAILSVGGIEVKYEHDVNDAEMKRIAEEYDAVYVAVGAQGGKSLRIDGVDLPGVMSAVELLEKAGDGELPDFTGKNVVVIGGGNVAMDCARTSVRAGAKEVVVAYRRRLEDMTALEEEVHAALAEGVEMVVLQAPVRIEANEEGSVGALICQPQRIGAVKGGRPAPVAANKPEVSIDADIVLIAVGQDIKSAPFEEFGMKAERTHFVADEFLRADGFENVFVGGDCQWGPKTVIMAIAAGKIAARNIDEFFGYNHEIDCGAEVPPARPNDRTQYGRVAVPERPIQRRKHDFEHVELPMTKEEALQECGRCLRCDVFGIGALTGRGAGAMVNLIVDGKEIQAREGMTLLGVCGKAGADIPTLCWMKGLNDIASCRVCLVECDGELVASCNTQVREGMVVNTGTPRVVDARRSNLATLMESHRYECGTCVRQETCALRTLASEFNVKDAEFYLPEKAPWDESFPLIRDASKCIKCMRCVAECAKVQHCAVWEHSGAGPHMNVFVKEGLEIDAAGCALCGQCITHCPTGALTARDDVDVVMDAILDPEVMTVVQVAPAVRAAWGEGVGVAREDATPGRMASALRALGFDKVFDTDFAADLTIMEEGSEFVEFVGSDKPRPMFTSCCPGWVRFVKLHYPQFVAQLSSAKSPHQMMGAVVKNTLAAEMEAAGKKRMFVVSVMPCVAKKYECSVPQLSTEAGPDVDAVLTVREFDRMLNMYRVDCNALEETEFDNPLGLSTGAGTIFGRTGGVMEAALRSAVFLITGENPDFSACDTTESTPEKPWVAKHLEVAGIPVDIAVASGLGNTAKLLDALEAGEARFDFVEIMACPGGCVGGGGQPIEFNKELACERAANLNSLDAGDKLRYSHENPDVQKLYEDWVGKPLSHTAHEWLHTDQETWDI